MKNSSINLKSIRRSSTSIKSEKKISSTLKLEPSSSKINRMKNRLRPNMRADLKILITRGGNLNLGSVTHPSSIRIIFILLEAIAVFHLVLSMSIQFLQILGSNKFRLILQEATFLLWFIVIVWLYCLEVWANTMNLQNAASVSIPLLFWI